jgi:hypothetical protein
MSQRKLALVTGASRGIGRGFAERLAKDGYDLLLTARSADALATLIDDLQQQHGIRAEAVVADLSRPEGVEAALAGVRGRPISLLVNNAGVGLGDTFFEQERADIERMLYLNVVALASMTRALLPTIVEQRGAIVNVASQAGFFPMPRLAAYAASKAFVLHLSEALSEELKDQPITVLALCPGPTQTHFFAQADIDLDQTRMVPATVEQVVEEGMRALAARKRIHVVGLSVRLSTWLPRFFPRALIAKAAGSFMRR